MTSRSYFGKMNSTLGSVVPLAMFLPSHVVIEADSKLLFRFRDICDLKSWNVSNNINGTPFFLFGTEPLL